MLTLFFACKKREEFSEIPYLEFTKYEIKDSVDALGNITKLCELHLFFTDGDGDIGLFEEDTIAPFDYNLFVDTFSIYLSNISRVF